MVPEVAVGQVVAGKYLVERLLGQGGMGLVLLARHLQLGQRVAIKVMRGEELSSAESRERFLREARAAACLQSEHVARVTDVGVLPSGSPFMVMEYIEGDDLARSLSQRGPMPVYEAVDCVLEACAGLAEAHAAGIVHRDLKPSNLFLARRPDGSTLVKVLDFGIAKAPVSSGNKLTLVGAPPSSRSPSLSPSLTATGGVMGSPHYMAPEQFESARDVDARADVWALGVILYQLLSGRRPFEGAAYDQIFVAIASGPPWPLRQLRPDVPELLEQVIGWCLTVDRGQRAPSVGRLASALAPFASARGASVVGRAARLLGEQAPPVSDPTPSFRPSQQVSAPLAPTLNTVSPPPRPPRSRLLLGLVLVVAAGAGSLVLFAVLGVGCLNLMILQSGARTAPLPRVDPSRVDALELLPAARALAVSVEPRAKLRGISVANAKGGVADLTSGGAVSFQFRYSHVDSMGNHQDGIITVSSNQHSLFATRSDPTGPDSGELADPRCSSRSAWKAAGGSPTATGWLALGSFSNTPGQWQVIPDHGTLHMIDAASCAAR